MSKISDLGERKVIDILLNFFDKMPGAPIPFGDDVSGFSLDDDRLAILKIDMLVGLTDIPPGMKLWQASRKALVMNVSDFSAKGVRPSVALVSLGLPRNMSIKEIKEIGKGLTAGAREHSIYIIGGDTNESSDLIIDCALFGICKKEEFIARSNAKPGDIVAVTGYFGKTSVGLKILMEKLIVPSTISNKSLEQVYLPRARLSEGIKLAESKVVTASIDSSDGLLMSLYELMKMSKIGFEIDNLPIAKEAFDFSKIYDISPMDLALYGGEEYELIVTIKADGWEEIKKTLQSIGCELIPIGKVINQKKIFLINDGNKRELPMGGWDHFKR